MNPFDGLPPETLEAIAVYALVGMIVFTVLGLWDLEKARRAAAKPATPVVPLASSFVWAYCPNGHCQVLANRDWSCPVCGAHMGAA